MKKRTFLTLEIITICILSFIVSPVAAATTPIPTPKATSTAITDAEIEREKQIVKELSLNMPDQSEDPNYPVTFIDPSKQGVDITIDDKTYTKAANPFLLPNLAIGEHKIIFKFKTKDGVVRVLTKKLLVTPKAPQFDQTLKTEVVRPSSVTIKGTALPQSTIMIVINSEKVYKISSTPDGKWEFIVPDPSEGKNNVVAFAIKSGIVSSQSKTFTVVYKLNASSIGTTTTTTSKPNQLVTIAKNLVMNIDANRKERPAIFYGVIGAAIIAILVLIDARLRKRAAKNRDEKTIATLFGNLQKDGGTIVDAIQSTAETVLKKKPKSSKQKKMSQTVLPKKVTPPIEVSETAKIVNETAPVTEDLAVKVQPKSVKATKPMVSQKQTKAKIIKTQTIKSTPLVDEAEVPTDTADETEEPEKKVLTKEEFLKQFQKAPEQDE